MNKISFSIILAIGVMVLSFFIFLAVYSIGMIKENLRDGMDQFILASFLFLVSGFIGILGSSLWVTGSIKSYKQRTKKLFKLGLVLVGIGTVCFILSAYFLIKNFNIGPM